MIRYPNIIFLGAPGSGKGTVAKQLVDKYGYLHLSAGDIFRQTLNQNTPLAEQVKEYIKQGKLVPDNFTNNMMKQYIISAINNNEHFILDGYPRTIDQAEFLKTICDIDLVVYLDISEDLATKRIIGRRNCPKCGEIYNIYFIQNWIISLKQDSGNKQTLINTWSESLCLSIFESILFWKFSFFIFILNSKYPRVCPK